jgi:hypothetical protein
MNLKTQSKYWLLLPLALTLALQVKAQTQRAGTFKAVQGEVSVVLASTARVANVEGALQQADRIVTGRNASTTFMLKDGTVVSVGPNSTLELAKIAFDPVAQEGSLSLSLLQGTIRVVTGWLAKLHPESVQVMTPTTVVGVRGTDFIVEVP